VTSAPATSAPLEVLWIDDPEDWARYRDGWDDLVEKSSLPSIFSTWDFLECSWLHFARPRGARLAIIAVLQEGRPVGFAPWCLSTRRRFGLTLRRLHFLATWQSDRARPIFAAGRETACTWAVLDCLQNRARDWDLLELAQLATDEPLSRTLREWAARQGYRLTEQPTSQSPYVTLPPGGESVMARLGSRMREGLRRHRRKLEAQGPCLLEIFEKPEEMGHALDLYFDVERRSWKPGAQQGAGKDDRNEAFYRELLPRLARKNLAAVKFLTQGGRPLAGEITYRLGTTVYGNQWTFDNAYATHSPGNLLRALSLDWHAAAGAERFEMYARFLSSKLRWTSTSWDNATFRIYQTRGLRRLILFTPGRLKTGLRALLRGASKSTEARAPEASED
jgi:CelD/BcsL family acetyltransferase involved in cellulose biosynthesis